MYVITYGGSIVHDPSDDVQAADCSMTLSLNQASSLSFSIAPTHPLSGRMALMDVANEVVVTRGGSEVFRGRLTSKSADMDGIETYAAEGQRAYLNDVLLPVYDTSDGTGGAPSTADGLFEWYIAQYNKGADASRRLVVGINQAASMDSNNYVYRANSNRPSVWAEIKSKLLDELGGYVIMRMDGERRVIDYVAGATGFSGQEIRAGENLLSFSKSDDETGLFTAVVPIGKDSDGNEVTIDSLDDGWITPRHYKDGGRVIDSVAQRDKGVIECLHKCSATTPSGVLSSGIKALQDSCSVSSFSVGALDLSMCGVRADELREGSMVRIVSRDTDVSLTCTARTLNPFDPASDTYEFGQRTIKITDLLN